MTKFRPLIIFIVILLSFLFLTGIVAPMDVFDIVLLQPMLNLLTLLSRILFDNLGLAIIAMTVVMLIVMWPLQAAQMRSSRAMQELRPKLDALKKKYGKDSKRLQEETFKLYKEAGVSYGGCAFTMLIQMPIWIALYQVVIQGLANSPEYLFGLSKQLYGWSFIQGAVPLNNHFLWLDLSQGDIIMAILTAGSMWLLQKTSTPMGGDASQQSMNNMMLWMMPLMFGFFALSLPSALSVYWVGANVGRIIIQVRTNGWQGLTLPFIGRVGPKQAVVPAGNVATKGDAKTSDGVSVASQTDGAENGEPVSDKEGAAGDEVTSQRKRVSHGKHRDKRKVRGRSRRSRHS
jgi:YidC/Oxa1 family membrane protein insertase